MLNQALENWPEWGLAEEPSLLKTFSDGQNHHSGLIESGDQRFVLKVFEHSFSRTIEVEYKAAELEISPKLHMAANNMALYEFIEDQGYSPEKLSTMGLTLRRVHQMEPTNQDNFKLLNFCETYLTGANKSVKAWHTTLLPALIDFVEDPTPPTFCHNDLVTQNCLFKQDQAMFIDWEFAQCNNPWFDLAAIIYYFNLDDTQARKFLSFYAQGWQDKIEEPIFFTSKIAVLWCDLLWNIHTKGSDYKRQNTHRFDHLAALAKTVGIELPPESQ